MRIAERMGVLSFSRVGSPLRQHGKTIVKGLIGSESTPSSYHVTELERVFQCPLSSPFQKIRNVAIHMPLQGVDGLGVTQSHLARSIAYALKNQEALREKGPLVVGPVHSIRLEVMGETAHVFVLGYSWVGAKVIGVASRLEKQEKLARQLEEAVSKMTQKLEEDIAAQEGKLSLPEVNEKVGALVDQVLHDLNNLVTGALGYLDLTVDRLGKSRQDWRVEDTEKLQKIAGYSREAASHIHRFMIRVARAARDGSFIYDGKSMGPDYLVLKGLSSHVSKKGEDFKEMNPIWLEGKERKGRIDPQIVFILDDQKENRTILSEQLVAVQEDKRNFEAGNIHSFELEEDFLRALQTEEMAAQIRQGRVILFLDFDLPKQMTGVAFAHEIRKKFPAAPLPIILNSHRGTDVEDPAKQVMDGRVQKNSGQPLLFIDRLVTAWNQFEENPQDV